MKASNVFTWTPTSLSNAVKETVCFYKNIMDSRKFSAEKEKCVKELLDNLC